MKDIHKCLLCLILSLVFIIRVEALSVEKNSINITPSSSEIIELYASVENANKVEFNLVYSTYDIPADFIVNKLFKEETPSGIKHVVIFDEVKSGKILLGTINIKVVDKPKDLIGSISINNAKYYDKEDNSNDLKNQTITVKINKEDKKEEIDKNLLDKIESNIVNIKLKKDMYIYDININDDIDELDLIPIPKYGNTEVYIDTQKISELKDNKLVIKTKNNDIEQDYIINIKINKKEENTILIDNSEFKPDNSYKDKWKVVTIISSILLVIILLLCFKKK